MTDIIEIDAALLERMPLPALDTTGDKNERGQLLIIAGGRSVPGAPVLVGRAGLRAGAGKLQLAATNEGVIALGLAMPEARILPVSAKSSGEIEPIIGDDIRQAVQTCDALVLGPGMIDERAAGLLALELLSIKPRRLVLDAGALTGLQSHRPPLMSAEIVLTPHAGELAKLTGWDIDAIKDAPALYVERAARAFGGIVALKGTPTHIAALGHPTFALNAACPGLATSGSGDVLSGLIGGLLARGADGLTAAIWGVSVHARAGDLLSARVGKIGFLAREIVDTIPEALRAVSAVAHS